MNSQFIQTQVATTPHPFTYAKLKPFELLIGDWNFDWVGHNPDGTCWTEPGEWHFEWIIEGSAIQDTWICPGVSFLDTVKYPAGQYGTTIRFYDKKEDCVKMLWIGSLNTQTNHFRVSFLDNRIIEQKIFVGENQAITKWVFKDITNYSFTWETFQSEDRGLVWHLTHEVFARRNNISNFST